MVSDTTWRPDPLGPGYRQRVLPIGSDPDGQSDVHAVLVRAEAPASVERAVLYVHGFSDYFFQRELAEFYRARDVAFFGLDLRKCGRSRRPDQTPHYVSDLALYDVELDRALEVIAAETHDAPVLLTAHSTGGLIVPLWLDRRRASRRLPKVSGLVLNSPWFDLQGEAWRRGVGTWFVRMMARWRPFAEVPMGDSDAYGASLHHAAHGEWIYDLDHKPLDGFPVTYGWLNAVRRGHARLHRGLDVGVPSLVLRSSTTRFARGWRAEVGVADCVLDVDQIARWAGCLGDAVTSLPIADARHDVFLSLPRPRAAAYAALDTWLRQWVPPPA